MVKAVLGILPFSLPVVQLVPVMPPMAPPVVGPLGAPVFVPILQAGLPVIVDLVWGLVSVACRDDFGQLQRLETQIEFEEDLLGERSGRNRSALLWKVDGVLAVAVLFKDRLWLFKDRL